MKPSTLRPVLLLLIWCAATTAVGALHLLAHLPPFAIPALLASLTIGFSLALVCVPWLRAAADSTGARPILAAHLVRFVGFYFLWLHGQGRLPVEFAQRAGWGDIAAAGGALVLLFWPEGKGFRRALFWWNIIGALDLLLAVGTAAWSNLTRPGSMSELASLPLSYIPLLLVPLLLSSHIYLLRRHCAATSDPSSGLREQAVMAGR